MNQNNVTENVKRAMARAMLDEILQIIDSGESESLTPEQLATRLDKFEAELPQDKIEKYLTDDTVAKDIKEQFWASGNISCLNDTLTLRNTIDSDRDGFLRLQQEYSPLRSLLRYEPSYCARIWRYHNDNTSLMLSIIKSKEYIGYCGIKDISKEQWEISIELLPEWIHRGIGTAVITAMLDAVKDRLGVTVFRVRIDANNVASQCLFEKLGATPNGISKFILSNEDEILQCEEANLDQIDDTLVSVAKKFDVEPRKLLSHVLEYTLTWD